MRSPCSRDHAGPGHQALLDAGANAMARNAAGETPWDLAQANEALQGTDGYWRLNDARFGAPGGGGTRDSTTTPAGRAGATGRGQAVTTTCRRLRLRSSLTQSVESTGKIVLHEAAIAGRPFASEHLKSSAVGVHCLFQAHRVGFPFTQGPKGVAEVVLRHGPIERHLLTGTLFEGGAVRLDGLR